MQKSQYFRDFCSHAVARPGDVPGQGYRRHAGIDSMRHLHGPHIPLEYLTNGPGELTQALGITRELYGTSLSVHR